MTTHREWVYLNNERQKLRWQWHEFFKDFDLVLAPVSLTTAFPHDHSEPPANRLMDVDGEKRFYFQQSFWAGLTSVTFLPSTTIPTGIAEDGLPVGIQLIGDMYPDRLTIQIAQRLEEAGFGFEIPTPLRSRLWFISRQKKGRTPFSRSAAFLS